MNEGKGITSIWIGDGDQKNQTIIRIFTLPHSTLFISNRREGLEMDLIVDRADVRKLL